MPSGEVWYVDVELDITTKIELLAAKDDADTTEEAKVLAVHVMPSGLVAAPVPALGTARNTVPFQTIAVQVPDVIVRFVQVAPSGEVAETVEDAPPTAANTVPFHAIAFHTCDVGRVRAVQVMPSGLVAATVPEIPVWIARNTVPFQTIAPQLAEDGSAR